MRFILLIVFFFLLAVWASAWAAFDGARGLIHLLLLLAFVSPVIHFLAVGHRSVVQI